MTFMWPAKPWSECRCKLSLYLPKGDVTEDTSVLFCGPGIWLTVTDRGCCLPPHHLPFPFRDSYSILRHFPIQVNFNISPPIFRRERSSKIHTVFLPCAILISHSRLPAVTAGQDSCCMWATGIPPPTPRPPPPPVYHFHLSHLYLPLISLSHLLHLSVSLPAYCDYVSRSISLCARTERECVRNATFCVCARLCVQCMCHISWSGL